MTFALLLAALATDPAPASGPSIQVGTLVLTPASVDPALLHIDPGELKLQTCLNTTTPGQPAPSASLATDGQVQLQVTIRRGQVKLVTTTSVSSGLEWMTPCLERRLAEWTWPVKKADVSVPMTVAPAE